MNQEVAVAGHGHQVDTVHEHQIAEFVTFKVANQLFGVSVLQVQDILQPDKITAIPLAPREVLGSINLRGRIVTVIDVRARLELPDREDEEGGGTGMGVTVEHQNELYTLMVEEIGEVRGLPRGDAENVPGTLDPVWREFASCVYQLEKELMVVLDVGKFLQIK